MRDVDIFLFNISIIFLIEKLKRCISDRKIRVKIRDVKIMIIFVWKWKDGFFYKNETMFVYFYLKMLYQLNGDDWNFFIKFFITQAISKKLTRFFKKKTQIIQNEEWLSY